MAENFDEIELFQAQEGPLARNDPAIYRWLLHNFAAIKNLVVSLQGQITNISLTPGPPGEDGEDGEDGLDGTNGTNGTNGSNADVTELSSRVADLEDEVDAIELDLGIYAPICTGELPGPVIIANLQGGCIMAPVF